MRVKLLTFDVTTGDVHRRLQSFKRRTKDDNETKAGLTPIPVVTCLRVKTHTQLVI